MAAAARSADEGTIRSTTADGGFEESLRKLQSDVARALDEAQESGFLPAFSQLDWADGLPGYAASLAVELSNNAEYYRRGEEKLRHLAAWSDSRRAEAELLGTAARRLLDGYLRAMAAAAEEEGAEDVVVHMAAMEFLEEVYDEMGIHEAGAAARADEVDAAARAPGGCGARFAEKHARRADMLRRGAAAFEGRPGEEEKIVAALHKYAALVEAQCADAEALVAKMVSSPFWRVWRHVNGQQPSGGR